jgi:hypothetical protein
MQKKKKKLHAGRAICPEFTACLDNWDISARTTAYG